MPGDDRGFVNAKSMGLNNITDDQGCLCFRRIEIIPRFALDGPDTRRVGYPPHSTTCTESSNG
jgi:hypothetical protein